MLRVGIISSVNEDNVTARVAFEDKENTVSYELPILVRGTLQTKDYWIPEPGEQVWCLFLSTGNADGIILGSTYSDEDTPVIKDKNKRYVLFSDGTTVEYDLSTKMIKAKSAGTISLEASTIKIKGNVEVDGMITATEDIEASGISLTGHRHTNSAGTTTPPF